MPRVVHFEISADDAPRACRFYEQVFGWQTRKWSGDPASPQEYWLIETGETGEPGINGGLYHRHKGMSFTAHVNTIDVPSIDDFMQKIQANGGRVVTQKMSIPGVGYFAYCEDTEGNTFGILEAERSATA